ncbi:MAG: DUF3078 domain-containing protein [Flavobacteriaceae bacterium]|nr:DUF3078 domain-containing protein [Flavobacteriaceae bacterium]
MKSFVFLPFVLLLTIVQAQNPVALEKDPVGGIWSYSGKASLLFNQAAFSQWASGGVNNVSLGFDVDYEVHYKENGWSWDTKSSGSYGLSYIEGDKFLKKTNDRLEINSLLGKEFSDTWSYSTILNFKSQIARGYSFGKNEEGEEIRTVRTHLFSPAYLQFGVGLYCKKSSKLWVNIAPFTQRITFVSRKFTQDLADDKAYFGVSKGSNHLFELGASVSGFYKFEAVENVFIENRLALYSDYLGEPENIDFDYSLTATMKVNAYISTQLEIQLVYDDNAVQDLQSREIFGVGVNFDL